MAKEIQIKSYTNAGIFIKNITDATFDNFRKIINCGISDLTFKLARKIDNFNSNSDVSIGNKIEVWIFDKDTGSTGFIVYSGYIEQQNITIDGGQEYVEIICLGLISKLKNDILKEGSQTILYSILTTGLTITSASQSAAEIADIIKAIVDKYNAINTSFPIYYNLSGTPTIQNSGNNMQYTFKALSYFEAIEKCREVAPQNWHWFLDGDGQIYFKSPSETADHTFLINKHIKSIKASKSADSIKNIILIWDGASTYKQYKDDVSIAQYGRRVKQITDSNIKDTITMDNIGNSCINENKDPKIRIEIEIIDNNESDKGYDIESIKPGQTCKIVGIDISENIFNDNMLIKEVLWTFEKATLIIEVEKEYNINKYILDMNQKLETEINSAIPENYT